MFTYKANLIVIIMKLVQNLITSKKVQYHDRYLYIYKYIEVVNKSHFLYSDFLFQQHSIVCI